MYKTQNKKSGPVHLYKIVEHVNKIIIDIRLEMLADANLSTKSAVRTRILGTLL